MACHHFIYFGGWTIKKLKKKETTFSRTFFSVELKNPEMILKDDVLRDAGIAELLVDMGRLNEKRKETLMEQYEAYE